MTIAVFWSLLTFWRLLLHKKSYVLAAQASIKIVKLTLFRMRTSICPNRAHARRKGGRGGLNFDIFCKKGCFLIFEWENQISPLLVPPLEKFWKNPLVPPEKIHPTPMIGPLCMTKNK